MKPNERCVSVEFSVFGRIECKQFLVSHSLNECLNESLPRFGFKLLPFVQIVNDNSIQNSKGSCFSAQTQKIEYSARGAALYVGQML